ncbi:MAG TPA: hypothetical protein VLA74_01210 [Nitrososphaeraceae archaeon]|nr:hypothetical protein [Nitrososphaeraceae archaeon]
MNSNLKTKVFPYTLNGEDRNPVIIITAKNNVIVFVVEFALFNLLKIK